MKKIITSLIILLALLTLVGCASEYKPQKSTKEESRVVMTLSFDGDSYQVKYELYRMLFLNNKSLVDGGDPSVWSGPDKDKYVEEIDKIIAKSAAEIYSVFHVGKELGIKPYSKEIDKEVEELIRISVEGSGDVVGHGSYEAFLDSLKERNMNYSVHDLLLRYTLVYDRIVQYYGGETEDVLGNLKGELEYTKEDVRAYYESADSARVLQLFFADGVKSYSDMQGYRDALTERASSPLAVAQYIIQRCPLVPSGDVFDSKNNVVGITVGRHELDLGLYENYVNAALALSPGAVSGVIELDVDGTKTYYVLYGLEKTEEYFTTHYDRVEASYIEHTIGKNLNGVKVALASGAQKTGKYEKINHAEISMD